VICGITALVANGELTPLVIPYAPELACGACVRAGYYFCQKGTGNTAAKYCCQDMVCAATHVATNHGARCSQDFDDRTVMLQ